MQLQEAHRHRQLNGQESQQGTKIDGHFNCLHVPGIVIVLLRQKKWLSEDLHRQRCEVKARRDAKMCCKILTVLGRREWKTWNDVPLELENRNLGHATVDQLERLFRDANVSDDAVSALKHSFEMPSVKEKSGSESCRDLQ